MSFLNKFKTVISEYLSESFPRWRMYNILRHKRMELKREKRPIRVLFLVSDSSKWKCQSVYDAMKEDPLFEPLIVLTALDEEIFHDSGVPEKLMTELKEFFTKRNMPFESAFDVKTGEYCDLRKFMPDIIFYQQPWALNWKHSISKRTSFYALSCYVSYFSPNYGSIELDCQRGFHDRLWRYYLANREWIEIYEKNACFWGYPAKRVATGMPFFDEFRQYAGRKTKTDRPMVIFAPHYSIDSALTPNPVNYSTFQWTGKAILEYAKRHREFCWIFKPHPRLRFQMVATGFMTEEETEKYFSEWESLGEVCNDGNYLDLFFRSFAMITDSASFLTEYACTEHPIIHLISRTAKVQPMRPNRALYDTYYKVRSLEEMLAVFECVLEKREDPNRDKRLEELKKCGYMETNAAENIVQDIKGALLS